MKKVQQFVGSARARFGALRSRLLFALVSLMVVAVSNAQASAAFTEFDTAANALIDNWGTIAVGLCTAWVVVKLGPKFIKRLTSAV